MNKPTRATTFSIAVALMVFLFLRWAQASEENRQTALTLINVGQSAALLGLALILLTIALRRKRR